ncbi:hypothetical protein DSO57_1020680 [Entomophthora muscae]|uniref:Uncharacterized protein n=1 Tax=Entomophthora muscae TaxID=34485 RepID=A0ACC2T3Q1_9FUNG|nr:hypothetical protein DSO57_1020680 [Entomophthora muscae]
MSKDIVDVGWDAVAYSGLFICFNVGLSLVLGLRMELSLIVSSARCLVQLTVMGYVLGPVLNSSEMWVPLTMSGVFVVLAAYEAVFHQSKLRYRHMFPIVFVSVAVSTGVVALLGIGAVMRVKPFYLANQFVPLVGLLLGNSIAGISIGIRTALMSLAENQLAVEAYLSMGASRWEASRPIAIRSIQLGMMPTVNAMSAMGIISIPGMMTGQILGGADVMVAVRYQIIAMFMVASTTSLAILMCVSASLLICIDNHHRHRDDRIFRSLPWHHCLLHRLARKTKASIIPSSQSKS